ncbi:hypothetical protein K439DRAFT_810955 [Ramaria rubella]|nr:hypothetical protein K439DRAFT_810955 [Ramaria rubella]
MRLAIRMKSKDKGEQNWAMPLTRANKWPSSLTLGTALGEYAASLAQGARCSWWPSIAYITMERTSVSLLRQYFTCFSHNRHSVHWLSKLRNHRNCDRLITVRSQAEGPRLDSCCDINELRKACPSKRLGSEQAHSPVRTS